jgi:hypothetical protein
MTSSKAIVKAVIDDGAANELAESLSEEQPEHGIALVRQDQVYYTAGLARSALFEAGHIVQKVQDSAAALRMPREEDLPLDMRHVLTVIGEALDCVDVASEALSALCTDIRLRQADTEP